jgi:hypothetical protein
MWLALLEIWCRVVKRETSSFNIACLSHSYILPVYPLPDEFRKVPGECCNQA